MPTLHRRRRALREETEDSDESQAVVTETSRRSRRHSTQESESVDEDGAEPQESRDSAENKEHLARKLVRYALACEFSKRPVKRTEINQKVLGIHSKQFKAIFDIAQRMLNQTFAMQLEELPAGEKITLQQRRAAKRSERPSGPSSTNNFVLVSTLPEKYRIPEILCPPVESAPAIAAEQPFQSLTAIIISLIYLSGGSITEQRLDSLVFRRMNVSESESLALLSRMLKEGYLAKFTESANNEERTEYLVGPRGKVQFGEQSVQKFVQSVWQAENEAEETQLGQSLERTLKLTSSTRREMVNSNRAKPPKRKATQDGDSDEEMLDAPNGRGDEVDSDEDDSDESSEA